jgi:hypothetical protein
VSLHLVVLVFLLPAWFMSAIPVRRAPHRFGECGHDWYGWSQACPKCAPGALARVREGGFREAQRSNQERLRRERGDDAA